MSLNSLLQVTVHWIYPSEEILGVSPIFDLTLIVSRPCAFERDASCLESCFAFRHAHFAFQPFTNLQDPCHLLNPPILVV